MKRIIVKHFVSYSLASLPEWNKKIILNLSKLAIYTSLEYMKTEI